MQMLESSDLHTYTRQLLYVLSLHVDIMMTFSSYLNLCVLMIKGNIAENRVGSSKQSANTQLCHSTPIQRQTYELWRFNCCSYKVCPSNPPIAKTSQGVNA